jgi:hypothetical protein
MGLSCAQFWGCHCLSESVLWRICVVSTLISAVQCILGLIFGSLGWIVASSIGLLASLTHLWALSTRKPSIIKHLPGHFIGQHIASIVAINLFKDAAGIAINSVCLISGVLATYTSARLSALWNPPQATAAPLQAEEARMGAV